MILLVFTMCLTTHAILREVCQITLYILSVCSGFHLINRWGYFENTGVTRLRKPCVRVCASERRARENFCHSLASNTLPPALLLRKHRAEKMSTYGTPARDNMLFDRFFGVSVRGTLRCSCKEATIFALVSQCFPDVLHNR